MSFLFGGNNGSSEAKLARADEQARQEKIRQGTSRIAQIFDSEFNDDFFNRRRDSYLNYARPQLQSQYDDAGKELTFSLARSGMLDSSVRGEKQGELQRLFDLNNQGIADEALAQANSVKTDVEGARSNLVGMLNATGDQEGAVNSALTRAKILSKPEAYSPLGQLFTDFTSGLGTQAAHERAALASNGAYNSRYNTKLFGGGSRVTYRN